MDRPFALSAKAVIRDAKGRCLLLRRAKTSRGNPGKWDLPGGKVRDGETLDEALLREVGEETGLDISIDRVIGASEYNLPAQAVVYVVLEASLREEGQKVRLNAEHDEYVWVESSKMASMNLCRQYRTIADRLRAAS